MLIKKNFHLYFSCGLWTANGYIKVRGLVFIHLSVPSIDNQGFV